MKQYFITKSGIIIDETNLIIPMDENSPLYTDYLNYLKADGEVKSTDYEVPSVVTATMLQAETERYIKRANDGVDVYAKISAEFRLAKLSGQISEDTHRYIENILIPVRNEILAGQWISGKNLLIEIGEISIGKDLYDRLLNQITNYIKENY